MYTKIKDSIVGRYETSNIKTTKATSIKVVAGVTPYDSNSDWYYMYAQQRDYANNNNLEIGSTMIQGAAYDQVMKFVNTASYDVTRATNVGHGSSNFTTRMPYQTGGRDYSTIYAGTIPYKDKSKNIFDLEGNVNTWTTEAYTSASDDSFRIHRGSDTYFNHSASYRSGSRPRHQGQLWLRISISTLRKINLNLPLRF